MRDDPAQKSMRVLGKFAGALVLMSIAFVIALGVAVLIQEQARPSQAFLYIFFMSAFSGLMIASLTAYRIMTAFKSASLTLILATPVMITLMTNIVFFWAPIRSLVIDYAPWTKSFMNMLDDLIRWFEDFFGDRSLLDIDLSFLTQLQL